MVETSIPRCFAKYKQKSRGCHTSSEGSHGALFDSHLEIVDLSDPGVRSFSPPRAGNLPASAGQTQPLLDRSEGGPTGDCCSHLHRALARLCEHRVRGSRYANPRPTTSQCVPYPNALRPQ